MLLKEVEHDAEQMIKGWICPKCENVVSPTEKMCPQCQASNIKEVREEGKEILMG